LANLEEAVRVLAPHFQTLPAAHAPLMEWLAGEYQRLAEAAGRSADEALLAPVRAALARLASAAPAPGKTPAT
jgi:hypothetical protein